MKFFYTLKESALCIDEASGDLEPIGISSYYKQLMLNLALCVSVCLYTHVQVCLLCEMKNIESVVKC